MINTIIPQFFTTNFAETFKWYEDKLGFATDFVYGEPSFYGGVKRDNQLIYFRHQDELRTFEPRKYEAQYLDAMLQVTGIDALYKEFQEKGVKFQQKLEKQEWGARSFVVEDNDGRLLCFAEM